MSTFYDFFKVYAFDYHLAMYWWHKSYAYEYACIVARECMK